MAKFVGRSLHAPFWRGPVSGAGSDSGPFGPASAQRSAGLSLGLHDPLAGGSVRCFPGVALMVLLGALLLAGAGVMAQQQNCSWKVINGERVYVCCDGNGYCWRSNP